MAWAALRTPRHRVHGDVMNATVVVGEERRLRRWWRAAATLRAAGDCLPVLRRPYYSTSGSAATGASLLLVSRLRLARPGFATRAITRTGSWVVDLATVRTTSLTRLRLRSRVPTPTGRLKESEDIPSPPASSCRRQGRAADHRCRRIRASASQAGASADP